MNGFRCSQLIVWGALLLALGCGSERVPPPSVERVEQVLSVSFPDGTQIIGGTESPESALLCLFVSSHPLPLPRDTKTELASRSREGKRPQGAPFPASALSNLMASLGVALEDVPRLADPRGICHTGQVGDWQFTYREAPTERGWLTAVELSKTKTAGLQTDN
jgi:hypothetical protein